MQCEACHDTGILVCLIPTEWGPVHWTIKCDYCQPEESPMPIPLDDKPATYPSLKLRNVGDYAVIRLAHRVMVDKTDPVTNKVQINPETNKPRKQLIVTGLAVSGTAVVEGPANEDGERLATIPPAGTAVRLYVSGHRWGSLIEAEKAYGAALNVGDVVRVEYTGTEKSSMRGASDKKLWSFRLRAADASEDKAVAVAEALYATISGEHDEPEPVPIDDDRLQF